LEAPNDSSNNGGENVLTVPASNENASLIQNIHATLLPHYQSSQDEDGKRHIATRGLKNEEASAEISKGMLIIGGMPDSTCITKEKTCPFCHFTYPGISN
jgi:hypothetical protein